eukprot:SAG31_NODE_7221_length_1750_cov_4.376136_1_plen_163_part_00
MEMDDQVMQQVLQESLQEEQRRFALIDRQAALDIGSLGVPELRAVLARHNVDCSHCIERAELEALVLDTVPPASFDDDVIVSPAPMPPSDSFAGEQSHNDLEEQMLQEALAMSMAEELPHNLEPPSSASPLDDEQGGIETETDGTNAEVLEMMRQARMARFG